MWHLIIRRDISAVEVLLRSKGSQTHTMLPGPDHQSQGGESPEHLPVKISSNSLWVRLTDAGVLDIPLGLMRGITHRHAHLELQHWAAAQKVARTCREKFNCLASEQGLRRSSLCCFVPLFSPQPSLQVQAEGKSESPSN